jgi:hypothetical protein
MTHILFIFQIIFVGIIIISIHVVLFFIPLFLIACPSVSLVDGGGRGRGACRNEIKGNSCKTYKYNLPMQISWSK